MLPQDKSDPVKHAKRDLDIGQVIKRLDMLDDRLDNMDSVVTSLVERVMGRPLVLEITCPSCGETIQINVTSGVRLRGKE